MDLDQTRDCGLLSSSSRKSSCFHICSYFSQSIILSSILLLKFSLCQFLFILSKMVKRTIFQRDSEQQMICMARVRHTAYLVNKVSCRQRVDKNLLFLNIKVRQAQLLNDSLDELSRKNVDLKKKLKVTFLGATGLDMEGLTKEWFLLLDSCCHWFSSWNDQNTPASMATTTLGDLHQVIPVRLLRLLHLKHKELGVVKSYNLKPGAYSTNQMVMLYTDFLLNTSIYKQFAAFYHGFHSVCASDAMMLLRLERVEILVCGTPEPGMNALQKAAQYEGYSKSDLTVCHFWDVVLAFPLELQKKLLHFATGSDRVPVGGLVDLNFKIAKIDMSTDWYYSHLITHCLLLSYISNNII
uniref:HECT-type E3 ubiquitin transferase n=1 Tax=Oncorhynchus kisutch TaxID=8019 RepID=A0A8C7H933_ONCKI